MAKVWIRMIGNQKGVALIFTMFVVIGISLILANDFLKGVRQERQVGRAIKRIQAKGVEKFIADRGVCLLKDYVQATGTFPAGTGTTQISASQAAAGLAASQTFQNKLATEYALWKTRMTSGADRTILWLAGMDIQPLIAAGTGADFVCSSIVSSSSREYLLTFAIAHSESGAQQRISQKVLVNIGKLYDYSIFYSGDLEVQAAANMTLYGPIYAAGDAYLTTADSTTLTITAPSGSWTETSALQSSGNIYFGPKRTLAKNYFLSDSGGSCATSDAHCFNPKYAAGIREELRTHDDHYYTNANSVEVNPDYWYRSDQVEFRQWVDFVKLTGPSAPEEKDPLLPYFYYFMNELRYEGATTHTISITDSTGAVLESLSAPVRSYFPSSTQSTGGATSFINLSRTYYTKSTDYNENMSISSAFDPSDPPQLASGAETGSDRKPATNPNWNGVTSGGTKVVWDNAPTTGAGSLATKSIITGDASSASGSHLIIEPLLAGDSALVQSKKIQSKTNIRALCTDATCTAYKWEAYRKEADGTTFTLVTSGAGLPTGVASSNVVDYRLNRSIGSLNVDVSAVTTYANGLGLTSDNTLAIYLQTNAGPYDTASSYTALVKVTNGAQLPQNGWTLATNGRVWVDGNFNMYDYGKGRACTAGEWNYGVWGTSTCTLPPAAIFCDSFGVLSNGWDAGGYVLGTLLSARSVAADVYVNAAIITGTVSSQLVKAYPNCDGGPSGGGAVDFTGCRYADSTYALTTVQQSARVVNTGVYWKPIKSYADTSGSMGDFVCTNGLTAATGKPVTPGFCEYWLDNTTGIYYYNNRPLGAGSPAKSFALYTSYGTKYAADNPSWNIPLFGAAKEPYTKVAASPYAAEINFRANNMTGNDDFPDTQIPASSVFPGMSSAWTISRAFLISNVLPPASAGNYSSGGSNLVTVNASSPETIPLTFNPDNGAVATPQIRGAAYLGDFGYMPLWVPMYSGGLENLINLQESWGNTRTLHVRGSLLRLWDSVSLKVVTGGVETPAFYRTSYYAAPARDFRFDTSLRTNPPPASPDIIEVKLRDRWY